MTPCFSQATTMSASFADDVLACAEAGFQLVEVWLTKLEQHLEKESMEATKRLLADHRVKPVAAAYQGGLLLSQGEERRTHFDLCQRRLGLCQELAIETLLVVPDFADRVETADLQRARVSLAQAAQLAASYDVRLALEFRSNTRWCACLETAQSLVVACGEPNVGVALDAFHYWTGPSKLADVERCPVERLFHVQVCDLAGVPRELATDSDRVLPGDGDIDLPLLLEVLRWKGYMGPVSVELFNPELWQMKPTQVAGVAKRALDRMFATRA